MGVNFFSRKIGHEGGGPRASCLWMQKIPIFIFEYFPNAICQSHVYIKILSFLPPHLTRLIFCALQTIRWCSPLFELLCIFCAFTLWCPDCDGHEVCYSHSASSSSESVCIGGPSMMASAIYEAVCPGSCQPA